MTTKRYQGKEERRILEEGLNQLDFSYFWYSNNDTKSINFSDPDWL